MAKPPSKPGSDKTSSGGDGAGAARQEGALAALRAVAPPEAPKDNTLDILSGLRSTAPEQAPEKDDASATLDALRTAAPDDKEAPDTQADALDALRAQPVAENTTPDTSATALDDLRNTDLPDAAAEDDTGDTLDSLRRAAPGDERPQEGEDSRAALEALKSATPAVEDVADDTAEALDALRAAAPEAAETASESEGTSALDALRGLPADEPEAPDQGADALEALRAAQPEAAAMRDQSADALDALKSAPLPADDTAPDQTADALAALGSAAVDAPEAEDNSATLDALRTTEAPPDGAPDQSAAALASLPKVEEDKDQADDADAVLAGLDAVEGEDTGTDADDILAGLEPVADNEPTGPDAAATLATLGAPAETPQKGDTKDILATLDTSEVAEPSEAEDPGAILATLDRVEAPPPEQSADDVLSTLEDVADDPQPDDTAATLAGLEPAGADVAATDDLADALATLDAPEDTSPAEQTADVLARLDVPPPEETGTADEAADILAGLEPAPEDTDTGAEVEAALAGLDAPADPEPAGADAVAALATLDPPPEDGTEKDDLDALLADLDTPQEAAAEDLTDDILAELETLEAPAEEVQDRAEDVLAGLEEPPAPATDDDDLDALLSDLDSTPSGSDEDATDPPDEEDEELEALFAGLEAEAEAVDPVPDDLEALLAGLDEDGDEDATDAGDATNAPADDLDALLAGLDAGEEQADAPAASDDLDTLLAGLEGGDTPPANDDLDALLAGLEDDSGASAPPAPEEDDDLTQSLEAELEALMASMEDEETSDDGESDVEEPEVPEPQQDTGPPEATADTTTTPVLGFGQMTADRPAPQKLERKRFRLAILGDFTGRATRGQIDVGAALADRAPIPLDIDTVEDVIEGFATTLVLPIGKDGAGVEVKLGGLDDLHPDELYETVPLFSALRDLKSQLGHGGTAEGAAKSLIAWGEAHGQPVKPARPVSGGNTVRADLKLSDFQQLIGDTGGALTQPTPLEELLAQVVGPHIRKLPDADAVAMEQAVDDALGAAMRLILHHPDFQSVEAQWRAIDLIARNIETDDSLDVVLYDISAEEIAADLTQSDDLAQSGLARLLTEAPMDEETGRGAYSALIGLYTFEETPPHAELLGRIAQVAAHVDAPFFAAMTPGFMEIPTKDRHPLVARAWDDLRAMPQAGHLALASPRFLLRRPYGAKSEPIYAFDFEEFTQSAGLSGMLWANPVVLVSILLAKSFKENGASMELGSIMSLGDMPYHFVTDQHGDQIALPCTERNLTQGRISTVLGRGYLPVISAKGRNEVRLGSFQSLAGGDILGPWSGDLPPPPPANPEADTAATGAGQEIAPAGDTGDAEELDALLAGFDVDAPAGEGNEDDMDAELAALLADL